MAAVTTCWIGVASVIKFNLGFALWLQWNDFYPCEVEFDYGIFLYAVCIFWNLINLVNDLKLKVFCLNTVFQGVGFPSNSVGIYAICWFIIGLIGISSVFGIVFTVFMLH